MSAIPPETRRPPRAAGGVPPVPGTPFVPPRGRREDVVDEVARTSFFEQALRWRREGLAVLPDPSGGLELLDIEES